MARQRSRRAMACGVLPHVAVAAGFRIVARVRQLFLSLARHSSRRDCCKRLAVRVQSRRLLHDAPSNAAANPLATCPWRSEEHTSELQSLMRSSYAVFCLKKKKHKIQTTSSDTATTTNTSINIQ